MKTTLLTFLAILTLAIPSANAGIVVFNIQSSSSSLAVSGTANVSGVGNFVFGDQATGSRVTQFAGTITVDVDSFSNPTSITFLSADVQALVNGQWLPAVGGGSLNPAGDGNYGVATPFGFGAWRNLTFGIGNNGAASIDGSGNFASGTQQWAHSGGQLDLRIGDDSNGGTSNLTEIASDTVGNTGGTANYSSGPIATLTLPVAVSFNYLIPGTPTVQGVMNYNGTLVATAVPEPSSAVLLGSLTLLGLAFRRR